MCIILHTDYFLLVHWSERALHDVLLAVLAVLVFLIKSPALVGGSLTVVPQSIASRIIEMPRQGNLHTKHGVSSH